METVIVAQITDNAPSIYRVHHETHVDPVAAIKAAAQEYIDTPDGQDYMLNVVGMDCFNWGDAAIEIPNEILARYGVSSLLIDNLGANIVVVDHDEEVA